MRAVIIDDEAKARSLLKTILIEYCEEIKEIYEAEDLPKGVIKINQKKPDIVFLDVEMPEYAGTQILDFFDESQICFNLIFTTAHSNYAIKAFELNAISYLLKPLRPNQIKEAVNKVLRNKSKTTINHQLKELSSTLKNKSFKKIGLPISDGVWFIKLDEIYYLKADGMYTNVYTQNDGVVLVSKPLKYFVDILTEVSAFFRTHRSFLINKNHINQLVKKDGGYVIMDNKDIVAIAKDKLSELAALKEI